MPRGSKIPTQYHFATPASVDRVFMAPFMSLACRSRIQINTALSLTSSTVQRVPGIADTLFRWGSRGAQGLKSLRGGLRCNHTRSSSCSQNRSMVKFVRVHSNRMQASNHRKAPRDIAFTSTCLCQCLTEQCLILATPESFHEGVCCLIMLLWS